MFQKNKRRNKSTYLTIENGEVVDLKTDINRINARNCDDFTEEDLKDNEIPKQQFSSNGLPICEPSLDNELASEEDLKKSYQNDKDDTVVSDMKISLFNIFKFIFIFCMIALFCFILYKALPLIQLSTPNNNQENNSSIVIENNIEEDNKEIEEINHINKKELEIVKMSMNTLNTNNDYIQAFYNYLTNYGQEYASNTTTIYSYEKNIEQVEQVVNTYYLQLLNSEISNLELDIKLFELYKTRYDNLSKCIQTLKDEKQTNRGNVIDIINKYIDIDNVHNQECFDLLIEFFNMHGLSYTITDTSIILNE